MNTQGAVSEQGTGRIRLPVHFEFSCIGHYRTLMARLLVHARPERIVLDFSEVDYIDSVGLATLISWERLCKEKSTALVLEDCSRAVLDELKLLGVHRLFYYNRSAPLVPAARPLAAGAIVAQPAG